MPSSNANGTYLSTRAQKFFDYLISNILFLAVFSPWAVPAFFYLYPNMHIYMNTIIQDLTEPFEGRNVLLFAIKILDGALVTHVSFISYNFLLFFVIGMYLYYGKF